jgi:subtilisin family serine protease
MIMRPTRSAFILLGAVLMFPAAAQDDCTGVRGGPVIEAFVPGRVIVVPRLEAVLRDFPGPLFSKPWTSEMLGETGAFRIDSTKYSARELKRIFSDPLWYSYADSDYYVEGHGRRRIEPNDTEYACPDHVWGLEAIDAPEAWAYGQGRRSVVAAIVDSRIFLEHEDLKGNLFRVPKDMRVSVNGKDVRCDAGSSGYDGVDGDCEADCQPDCMNSHGTSIAGIVGASGDNAEGVTGVNWSIGLLPVVVLDDANRGCESRVVKALEFVRRVNAARTPRIRVLNLSWGNNHKSPLIERELKQLAKGGVVIVASAGNEGHDIDRNPVYPASFKTVPTLIAVAAADRNRCVLGNSNHGIKTVHIAAPGLEIYTTFANDTIPYRDVSRTSMAAPFVTGAVALLASQCPNLDAVHLRNLILRNADVVKELKPFVAKGRFLNVARAAAACRAAERRLASK